MTECVMAYAKINLHLDISEKRDDGYHNVETVMQTVSLCDRVSVTLKKDGDISCECNVCGVPTDEKNIAVKAAHAYCEKAGMNKGAHIIIEKNIPMAAGLAGGSTDAAATLIALNRLCNERLSLDELREIASGLGADVPFCIEGGTAYSDGKGDVLHEFPSLSENTVFVVACGGEGVSTPWAYGLLDRTYNDFEIYTTRGTDALRECLLSQKADNLGAHIFNIFEEPIIKTRPVATEIKMTLLDGGAQGAMMSGSGPSVFGIFESVAKAKMAADTIIEKGYFAQVCTPVSKRKI